MTLNMKYFALVVLLLVATFLITSSEARALNLESGKGTTTPQNTSKTTVISTKNNHGQDYGSVVDTEADLRPTTPGHSPGAGHSVGPSAFDPQP